MNTDALTCATLYPDRKLFLAVPLKVYDEFFTQPLVEKIVSSYKIAVMVFDPDLQTIAQWIKP